MRGPGVRSSIIAAGLLVVLTGGARAQDVGTIEGNILGSTSGSIHYWIGQDLLLTIESDGNHSMPAHDLNTLKDLFAALSACWTPPGEVFKGMQMSIRFSFKRNGDVVAAPRLTYALHGAPEDVRKRYRESIDAAVQRCSPLKLTAGLGGAIAGRPIAIRYVENRNATQPASAKPPRDPKLEGLNF